MRDRVKRIDSFEKATKMKIMRREDPQEAATNPNTNEIDQTRPFLEHSIPVTRSPKVSGAGVQLSNRVTNLHYIFSYSTFWGFSLFRRFRTGLTQLTTSNSNWQKRWQMEQGLGNLRVWCWKMGSTESPHLVAARFVFPPLRGWRGDWTRNRWMEKHEENRTSIPRRRLY